MDIIIPYSFYGEEEGKEEQKVTSRELRTFVLLSRMKRIAHDGENTAYITVALLESLLKYDKNETRSKDKVLSDLESLKNKGYIQFERKMQDKNQMRHHEPLLVRFSKVDRWHKLNFKHFENVPDEDELMILGFIEKWSGAKYGQTKITEDNLCKLLEYTNRKTIEKKIKSLVDRGIVDKEKTWNVEKGHWKPNKYTANDPNTVVDDSKNKDQQPEQELEVDEVNKIDDGNRVNVDDENSYEELKVKTNFFKGWKEDKLRVDDFEILLTCGNEKFIKDVRKKLENVAKKSDTLAEMFERLENQAVDELEKAERKKSLMERTEVQIRREMEILNNPDLRERLEKNREEERIENENKIDLTNLWENDKEYEYERAYEEAKQHKKKEDDSIEQFVNNQDKCLDWLNQVGAKKRSELEM